MRAKKIYEVEFERGRDPKDSMDIGLRKMAMPITSIRRFDSHPADWQGEEELIEFLKKYDEEIRDARKFLEVQIDEDNIPGKRKGERAYWGYYDLDWLRKLGWPGIRYKDIYIPFDDPLLSESIEFERGKDPKEAMRIGKESKMQYEFLTYFDAADWAVRNLELITDYKYSPNDVIRKKGAEVMPRDLVDYLQKWVIKVDITGAWGDNIPVVTQSSLLREIGNQMREHGILIEGIEFERGQDPKKAMGIGLKERAKQLEWDVTDRFLNQLLDDRGTEIISYKGYLILLYKPNYPDDLVIYNPWNSDDIWAAIANVNDNHHHDAPSSRSDGRKRTLANIKRTIDRRIKKISLDESVDFERGQDPKEAMKVGKAREKEMVAKAYQEMAGGNLDMYSSHWDFHKEKLRDHTAYVIEVNISMEGEKHKAYISLIPGVTINTQFYLSPKTSLEFLEERLDRLSESIEFERGKDPKEAMKIGKEAKIREMIDAQLYDLRLINLHGMNWDYKFKKIRHYDSYIIHIKENLERQYIGLLPGLYATGYEKSPGVVIEEMENYLNSPESFWMVENIEFERGQDPKSAMRVGLAANVEQKIYDIYKDNDSVPSVFSVSDEDLIINTFGGKRDLDRWLKERGYDRYLNFKDSKRLRSVGSVIEIRYGVHKEFQPILKNFSHYDYGRRTGQW